MESKIDHERSKLSDRPYSYFAVQNRRANEGFVTLKSVLSMIGNGALALIVLFLVVSAMVTFSTIAIIVDEQRNLAGTMKSLGFFNDAIRKKYLIFRNMRTEIERVSITTLIIAISCGMIGIGFNLKNAFSGMMDRQIQEVWGFDLKISYDEEVIDSKRKEMEKVITDSGATCASVAEIPTIYRDRDLQEYTYIMVMDQEVVGDYYHVKDWDTGEEMTLPEDGVLIQNRMYETRGLKSSKNTFLVRLNGVDRSSLLNDIKNVLPEVTYQTPEMLRDQFSDMQGSFDSVVYMLTGLAIFMSIFVLANLTNIFVSRRRKEMIIMLDRRFQPVSWLIAIALETVFAFCIDFFVFRKARKLKVTDINA